MPRGLIEQVLSMLMLLKLVGKNPQKVALDKCKHKPLRLLN